MDEYFELCGQVFEWQKAKAERNKAEHRLRFERAATAFLDPSAVEFDDDEHSADEVRQCLIGRMADGQLARVTFTERPPHLRLISARFANDYDEKQYGSGS